MKRGKKWYKPNWTFSDGMKGCWIGILVSIPFFIIHISIWGAGDLSLRLAQNLITFGGFVGLFSSIFEKVGNVKYLVFACALFLLIALCFNSAYIIFLAINKATL